MTCQGGRCGVDFEYKLAACDIKRTAIQYGAPILIRFHQEGTVERDKYNSIINRKASIERKLNAHALPLTFSPTTKQKSNAGIREDVDVIAVTPKLEWDDSNYSIDDLNTIKADVIIGDDVYEIVDKSLTDQFGIDYLNIALGLNRK